MKYTVCMFSLVFLSLQSLDASSNESSRNERPESRLERSRESAYSNMIPQVPVAPRLPSAAGKPVTLLNPETMEAARPESLSTNRNLLPVDNDLIREYRHKFECIRTEFQGRFVELDLRYRTQYDKIQIMQRNIDEFKQNADSMRARLEIARTKLKLVRADLEALKARVSLIEQEHNASKAGVV